MGYHRHVRICLPVAQVVDVLSGAAPEQFEYCSVCECVPSTLAAKDPVPSYVEQLAAMATPERLSAHIAAIHHKLAELPRN